MMMVGRSAAGQLPYSPLIQLSLIVRTTDCKNKQKDKRFIKICFFLSSQLMISIKKKLSCEIIFLQIQFFQRKCFFQWKCCIKIFFPDCAFLPSPCRWLRKVVLTLLRSKRTPAKRTNSLSPSLSIHTDLLQQEIQLWMDLMQELFF